MRKNNKELNIFNLSFLDVICGAMGAFLIVMVILLPYYKKETKDFLKTIGELRQELAETSQRLSEAEKELAKARKEQKKQITASLFGLALREKKIVVLLDLSGSLSADPVISKNNPCIGCIETLQQTVEEIISVLDDTFQAGLIGFHSTPPSYSNPRLLFWPKEGEIESMNHSGKSFFIAEAKKWLQKVKGGTPTQAALLTALDYPAGAILLLTDGNPTIPEEESWEKVVEVVTEKNRLRSEPMAIHTIAIGRYQDEPKFVDFLGALSRKNKGSYFAKFAPP